jgi:hypothetical protein
MSTISNITTGAQTVTATGAVTATTGLDISGVTGDYTVHLRVQGLSSASGTPTAAIQLEDTVNAFTAVLPVAVINVQGTVDTKAEQHFEWRKYQLPTARFGTASAKLRVNVMTLGGTTPSLTLDSWLES